MMAVKRRIAVVAVSVPILLATGVAIWWWDDSAPRVRGEAEREVDSNPVTTAGGSSIAAAEPSTAASKIPTPEELRVICPAPWSGIDDRCADALDARYLDEHVGLAQLYGHMAYRPRGDDRLAAASDLATWREVFADPETTRKAVAEALARPECLAPGNETPPNPEATCAADEVARLAMLHSACTEILDWYRRSVLADESRDVSNAEIEESWREEVDLLDDDASLTVEEYWRRRAEIEDDRFRFAWRLRRCGEVPRAALAWLDSLPTPSGSPLSRHQGRALTEAAARLGNEWARRELKQARVGKLVVSPEVVELLRREVEEKYKDEEKLIIIGP